MRDKTWQLILSSSLHSIELAPPCRPQRELDNDLGTRRTHLVLQVEPRQLHCRLDKARLGEEEEDGVLDLELHGQKPRVVDSSSTDDLLDEEHLLIQVAKLHDICAARGEQKSNMCGSKSMSMFWTDRRAASRLTLRAPEHFMRALDEYEYQYQVESRAQGVG